MSITPAGHVARSIARPNSETVRRTPLRTFLHTDDGVSIDSVYDPPAAVYDAAASSSVDLVFVMAHGFTGDVDKPHVRRVVEAFAQYGAVVSFSFRGHGASGGRSTVGDREVLDLAAAVTWARELGHARVATVGFSMGGSVVLRHAALYGPGRGGRTEASTDAVVSVSAPARWYYRGTAPMRKLHWLVTRPEGRLVGRYGFGTRIHHREWDPVPLSPAEAAARIAPTPLLIVHGDRDGYFPLDHPRMLAGAAGDHGDLWVEGGMGHAEHAATDGLLARIGDWAVSQAG
ncbi:alpha/beta hydrolase [Streptomyces sp. NBC_00201]|uniref:alpha/beta hydrolase n=1 Tax=unclassified Streptomyces TaxID=2593676 RepID=UPI0022523168|nr:MULTISPECIES: alpha/beta fold hydrolase [unclassified Streptomyces]MCX5056072.1 alpha/beta hydrolase [Streptomyces sp. NBC_00452]MCX5247032.1 alpha/beta hydrolase [Streptomyces sp. NBC_00201]MCX5287177.1 alpha/beta hydrolase [Streptomyces sp. NBC_00183]